MGRPEDLDTIVRLGWDQSVLHQKVTVHSDLDGTLHGASCSQAQTRRTTTLKDAVRARQCPNCTALPLQYERFLGYAHEISTILASVEAIEEGKLPLSHLHDLLQHAQRRSEALDAVPDPYRGTYGFDVRARVHDHLARAQARMQVALGGEDGLKELVTRLGLNAVANRAHDDVRNGEHAKLIHPWSQSDDGDELDLVTPWAEGVLDALTPLQRLARVRDALHGWASSPTHVDQLRVTPRRALSDGEDPLEWLVEEWRLKRDEAVSDLCERWEADLERVAELPESVHVGYHHEEDSYWTQDLNVVLAAWKPWRSGAVHVVCVPGAVGHWLETQGWTRVPVPADLTGQDRDRVLETLAGLWGGEDPDAPMSDVENALAAARAVCER